MDIGKRIQFHRGRRGLSQEALAEILGVTRQSVSKWELGQSLPDLDKVVLLSRLFNVTTDELILDEPPPLITSGRHILRWGLYLIVKDFAKSIHFYELLLQKRASVIGVNRFAEFRFDESCWLSIMNEGHLPGHDTTSCGSRKFTLNLWTYDLAREYSRVKDLRIGPVTEILRPSCFYYFFNLTDPDENIIEITGKYHEGGT